MSAHRASPPSNMASTHSYLPPTKPTTPCPTKSTVYRTPEPTEPPVRVQPCEMDTTFWIQPCGYKYKPVDALWMLCGLQSPFSFVQGQNVCCTPELCCKCDRRPAEKPKPTVDLFKELQFLRGYNLRVILSPGSRGATCLPES